MELKATLEVAISKQGNRYVAYAPALDISTSGKTQKEAKKRFGELVALFFEELEEAGTTDEVLSDMGWKKAGVAAQSRWVPPEMETDTMEIRVPIAA